MNYYAEILAGLIAGQIVGFWLIEKYLQGKTTAMLVRAEKDHTRAYNNGTAIARWYHLGYQVSRLQHPHVVNAAWRWADADLLRASRDIDTDIINGAIRAGARL